MNQDSPSFKILFFDQYVKGDYSHYLFLVKTLYYKNRTSNALTVNPHSVPQGQGIFSDTDYYCLKASFTNLEEDGYSE